MTTTDLMLIWATILGPIIGVVIGWLLSARSDRRRQALEQKARQFEIERAEQAAKFEVARGLLRGRGTLDFMKALNEIPLYFAEISEIMRLYRDVAYARSNQIDADLARLVLAVVRAVGFSSSTLELDDISHYIVQQANPQVTGVLPQIGPDGKPLQRPPELSELPDLLDPSTR